MATANGASNKKKDYRLRRQKRQQIRQLIDAIESNDLNSVFNLCNSVLDINFPYRRKTPLEVAVELGHVQICCALLQKGADVNRCNQGLNNLLNIACQKGYIKVAEVLIMNSADIDSRNEHGATPLHSAVLNGFVEVASMLLNNGCDVDIPNDQVETPLMTAVRTNNHQMVDLLLNHNCLVDAHNFQMITALMIATGCGYLDIVGRLLIGGADINRRDRYGCTALFYAVSEGYRDVVKLLLSSGSDADIKTVKKLTCLTEAIRKNHIDVAMCLLDYGCNVNMCDRQGASPILVAISQLTVYFGQQENPRSLVNRFIELKCDVNLADSSGIRPLYQSAMGGDFELSKLLLENGADINAVDGNGDTVLHAAAYGNSFDLVKLFIELGCDINKQNDKGETVLWPTISSSNFQITEYLVKHGADINLQEKTEKMTPLHIAIAAHNIKAVRFFIESGCELNKCNTNGQTPLLLACEKGDDEVVEMLLAQPRCKRNCSSSIAPLHIAVEYGHLAVVKKLVEGGWNINQMNNVGQTAVQLACSLDSMNMVKLLLMYGCDLNAHASFPLLVHLGADDDDSPFFVQEPFYSATVNKNIDMIKLLIKCYQNIPTKTVKTIESLISTSSVISSLFTKDMKIQIAELMQKAHKYPRSLMEICRVVIRHQLGVNPRAKLDTIEKLAPSHKDYICMVEELKIDSPHIYKTGW
ncbi:ankyrin-3-like isoform X1 [Octopus vulgaris]|uniref:Ankyrin-3-like isoform X1 n=2 Tax=Octopus TaxID=6643 RepID=A0AA36F4Q6_OCTVU|nr:putative ankyrin repeat protein RF_0381 [Octopus sinensis]CAI9725691.1 ankyrin-3-like isoform X1 [Octopus vulgaris]